jgi:tripartite-type tricarboxylate transporter receptor subunit TctC
MMYLKNRGANRSLASIVLTASVLSISLPADAQKAPAYPVQTISLVVAFSAGGAADIVARSITPKLSALLNTSVVVENKPGANGNIAASYVAKASADGYTLLMGFPGLASNPSLYKKMAYDPAKDLAPIKMLANAPVLLVVAPNLPVNTVADLIALAKGRDKQLNFGSGGQGASGHMAGELFKMLTGIQMQHVPYKGGAPALNDLMGGQIDLIFDSVPSSAPLVQGKKIKPLAIAGVQRSEALPEVPTFAQSGLPEYYSDTWFGILAPKAISIEIRDRLLAALTALVADPAMALSFKNLGLIPNGGSSKDFEIFLTNETAKWARVVEAAKISLD